MAITFAIQLLIDSPDDSITIETAINLVFVAAADCKLWDGQREKQKA